jgi:hypothetical protein
VNGRAVAASDMSTAAPEDEDDAALPPTAGGVVDRVAAALQAGLWKEKADPRTGRKYYVNTRTKKATWDLAKELSKKGASSSSIAAATRSTTPPAVGGRVSSSSSGAAVDMSLAATALPFT